MGSIILPNLESTDSISDRIARQRAAISDSVGILHRFRAQLIGYAAIFATRQSKMPLENSSYSFAVGRRNDHAIAQSVPHFVPLGGGYPDR